MRKITIMAALLGSAYFANAQVGIGTLAPANSSQLDIVANDKGVLIPRVVLTSTAVFAPISGTEVESLLVYNTATAGDVTPGFYYWFNNKWERIVNQTQLDDAIGSITDLQGDVSKIIALLKVAFPSNNLVDPTVIGDTHGGGMVFTPGTTPNIEYVYFDGTDYVKKDITADIIDIIKGAETKTTIGKSINNSTYTQVTVNPAAVDKIVYEYVAENATNYMDLTSDVEWSIENNTDVQNAIEEIVNNLLSQGGNVYFTRTDIAAGTPAGQLAIPAFSFYTIDATTGVKELVDIAQTIVNAITNANDTQITSIKNALGDKIIDNSSIITGDTYNSKAVRKGLFTTTITANTATTSGITLDEAASEIISITVKYGAGQTVSVTDLVIDGTGEGVSFNIGTRNMYQVLGTSDIDADVIIEFVEL